MESRSNHALNLGGMGYIVDLANIPDYVPSPIFVPSGDLAFWRRSRLRALKQRAHR